MYGARLLHDICERPEYYFVQKPIARTDGDYKRFHAELFNIYQTIRLMYKNDAWFRNEQQCEATFRCSYIPFCYNNKEVVTGDATENFRKSDWVDGEVENADTTKN